LTARGEEIAIRDLSGPIHLDELYEQRFDEPLAEGSHVIRAYLSRSNHEGIKIPRAFAMVVFHNGSRTPDFTVDRTRPMLTYGRPQGCASDPSRLLDFFLTNLNDLSERGYRVAYTIDGTHRGTLLGWAPYRVDGLRPGNHTLRLVLLRPDGAPAPGRYNDVTRTIRISNDCPDLGLIPDDISEDEEVLD